MEAEKVLSWRTRIRMYLFMIEPWRTVKEHNETLLCYLVGIYTENYEEYREQRKKRDDITYLPKSRKSHLAKISRGTSIYYSR